MRCKLHFTENPRSFEKYPTPPQKLISARDARNNEIERHRVRSYQALPMPSGRGGESGVGWAFQETSADFDRGNYLNFCTSGFRHFVPDVNI